MTPPTDLGATLRTVIAAPLNPAQLAAAVCTAVAEQFTRYADHEQMDADRRRQAGNHEAATKGAGTATAYRRAATQMRDLARMLNTQPNDPNLWRQAINATPDTYREFISALTDAEGIAMMRAGLDLDPIVRYGRVWQEFVWPQLLDELDELIRTQGGTVAARINAEQTA